MDENTINMILMFLDRSEITGKEAVAMVNCKQKLVAYRNSMLAKTPELPEILPSERDKDAA